VFFLILVKNQHQLLVCRVLEMYAEERGTVKLFDKHLKVEEQVCIFSAVEGSCHLL
jgi:hypothetical protein